MYVTNSEIKNKGIVILYQILFFTSFFFLRHNNLIESILISKKRLFNCGFYGINMLFFFETMKFIEYKLNLLPKYNEHPIASLVISFILLFIYFSLIYLASILMKKSIR